MRFRAALGLLVLAAFAVRFALGEDAFWNEGHASYDALIHAHFSALAAPFWAHASHRACLDLYLIVFAAGWIGHRPGLEPARRSC